MAELSGDSPSELMPTFWEKLRTCKVTKKNIDKSRIFCFMVIKIFLSFGVMIETSVCFDYIQQLLIIETANDYNTNLLLLTTWIKKWPIK
jgi:hypothetical protein